MSSPKSARLLRIESGGRLIQQQHGRLGGQRPADFKQALRADRHGRGRLMGKIAKADHIEIEQALSRICLFFTPHAAKRRAEAIMPQPVFVCRPTITFSSTVIVPKIWAV